MKTSILKSIIRAAAVLALPVAAWAAADTGLPNTGGYSSSGSSFSQSSNSNLSTNPGTDSTSSSGIVVKGGAAYIVHRLQSEMSLPDGSKVEPNGTIMSRDGATRSMPSGEMLTLDGRVMSAPFSGSGSGASTFGNTSGGSGSSIGSGLDSTNRDLLEDQSFSTGTGNSGVPYGTIGGSFEGSTDYYNSGSTSGPGNGLGTTAPGPNTEGSWSDPGSFSGKSGNTNSGTNNSNAGSSGSTLSSPSLDIPESRDFSD